MDLQDPEHGAAESREARRQTQTRRPPQHRQGQEDKEGRPPGGLRQQPRRVPWLRPGAGANEGSGERGQGSSKGIGLVELGNRGGWLNVEIVG